MTDIMFRIIFCGGIILNLTGLLLNITGIYNTGRNGFYSYDLGFLVHFPYWLLANIIFLAATLTAGFYLSDECVL